MEGDIAKRWKELSGMNKWKDLLDPLDLDLCHYILHYGDMAEVAYYAFNCKPWSKCVGDSSYSKEELFDRTGYPKARPLRYEVTKYIYATSSIRLPECFITKTLSREAWNKESNWLGYVAVATDEGKRFLGRRDIVVAWRGTKQLYEWANDFDFPLQSALELFPRADPDDPPRIAHGWLSLYTTTDPRSRFDTTSAQQQVQGELKRLLELYKHEKITITLTGHSLGAVLSILSAADFLYNEWPKIRPSLQHKLRCVTVFAFGSPRIGDNNFKTLVESIERLHILRVSNVPDLITHYPVFKYKDVGEELKINTLTSRYLKRSPTVGHFHRLDVYLRGVAVTPQDHGVSSLEINRNIELVNEGLDPLEDSDKVNDNEEEEEEEEEGEEEEEEEDEEED